MKCYCVIVVSAKTQHQIEFAVLIELTTIVISQYACGFSKPTIGSLNHETTFIQVKDAGSVNAHHTVLWEVIIPIHIPPVQVDW